MSSNILIAYVFCDHVPPTFVKVLHWTFGPCTLSLFPMWVGARARLRGNLEQRATLSMRETKVNIFFTGYIRYIRAFFKTHGLFFFALRDSAFKVPIGVAFDTTKPDHLLLFLYLAIYQKKLVLNRHFENFDFGSGGATITTASGDSLISNRSLI